MAAGDIGRVTWRWIDGNGWITLPESAAAIGLTLHAIMPILVVSSQGLMVHSFRMSGRMRYGPASPWRRHNDRGNPSGDIA